MREGARRLLPVPAWGACARVPAGSGHTTCAEARAPRSIPSLRATPVAPADPAPPPLPPPLALPRPPPSASVTARRAAGPESSQPSHCSTRLPNCLHSPACECVCVYSVSHQEAEEVEEKEKEECTGRDRCGAHTHSHSVTLSERVSLAHTHAGSPGARRIPSAAEKLLRLSLRDFGLWEVHWLRGSAEPVESCPRGSGPREHQPPPPLPPGLSAASTTIAAAASGQAPRAGARGGPGTRAGLCSRRTRRQRASRVQRERPGAALALPPVGAEPNSVCKVHPARWSRSRRLHRARSAFPRGSRDLQSRGRPGPGRDAGRSCALCHERRLAAPRPGLAAPGRPGRPGQTPAGRGRRGGGGGQVPAPLRVLEPPGLPQPPRLALQSTAAARRAGGWRRLRERAGAQPHRRLPAAAPGGARACVPRAVHPHRPGAALQGRRSGGRDPPVGLRDAVVGKGAWSLARRRRGPGCHLR